MAKGVQDSPVYVLPFERHMHHVPFNHRFRPYIGPANVHRSAAWLLEAFESYKADVRNIRNRGDRVLNLGYQVVQHQCNSLFLKVGTDVDLATEDVATLAPRPPQQVNNVPASRPVPQQINPAAQAFRPSGGSSSNYVPSPQGILTLSGTQRRSLSPMDENDLSMSDDEFRGWVGNAVADAIQATGNSGFEWWSVFAIL